MTIPVWVEQANGTFTASVLGSPQLQACGDTRERAVAALRADLLSRVAIGEIVFVDVEPKGLLSLAGKYKDDPTLDDIVKEAYRYRDELKAQEFPE
jgi:hypothetical protein